MFEIVVMSKNHKDINAFLDWDFFADEKLTEIQRDGFKEVHLFEDIDSYSESSLVSTLTDDTTSNLELLINSYGGSVTSAMAMSAMIKRHEGDTVSTVVGIAASAATIVALSCDFVQMDRDALFMIHNAWTWAAGEAAELRKTADLLDKMSNQIQNIYVAKILSKHHEEDKDETNEKVKSLMANESWLTADEALELGLIDAIVEGKAIDQEATTEQVNILRNTLNSASFSNSARKIILNKINMGEDKNLNSIQKIMNWMKGNPSNAKELKEAMQEEKKTNIKNAITFLEKEGYSIKDSNNSSEEQDQIQSKVTEIAALNAVKEGLSSQLVATKEELEVKNTLIQELEQKIATPVSNSLSGKEKELTHNERLEQIIENNKK